MTARWRRAGWRGRRRGFPPVLFPLLVALGLSALFLSMVTRYLQPMIRTMAVSRATNLISVAISQAVDDCLSSTGAAYADFISLEKGEDGKVVSMTGNPQTTNHFKRLVVERLAQRLEELGPEELGIPIGSLTGSIWLNERGPRVRVRLRAVGDVVAVYQNSFTDAGVNQTQHRVTLHITACVYLLLPGEILPVTVEDTVPVVETVIVGEPPDTYLHLDKGDN
ncbi:MAG TPA: sporulation protein YunB [Clostridiales bacterium]|nr:sporulation protein YunB [Clostridiales bacterium]